jgi:hypothetical protein
MFNEDRPKLRGLGVNPFAACPKSQSCASGHLGNLACAIRGNHDGLVSCGGTARCAVEGVDHRQLEFAIGAVMPDGSIGRRDVDVRQQEDIQKE